MDLVFVNDDFAQTPVTSLEGLKLFDIVTDREPGVSGGTTHIRPQKQDPLPIRQRLTTHASSRLHKSLEKSVASHITWNGVTETIMFRSKSTDYPDPCAGVEMSRDPTQYIDIDIGVKYRWDVHEGRYPLWALTESESGKVIAFAHRKIILQDSSVFKYQVKHVLHIMKQCPLDIGSILTMFLCMNCPRLLKQCSSSLWRSEQVLKKEHRSERKRRTRLSWLRRYRI